jgi:calpain-7
MKALKLSSNVDEKKELKARCGALIDTADRIKNSDEWTPSVDPNTKEAQIGRWAASIDPRYSPGPAYQEVGSAWPDPSPHQSTLEHTLQSRRPGDFSSASGKSPVSSVSFPSRTQQLYAERTGSTLYRDDSRHTSMPLIDLSDDQSQTLYENSRETSADTQHKGNKNVSDNSLLDAGSTPETAQSALSALSRSDYQRSITAANDSAEMALERARAAKLVSPTHIHRLTEPLSTRKQSRKEDIILLKASVVNGFKCPPWDKTPAAADFLPENGQELFQYVRTHASQAMSNQGCKGCS